MHPRLNQIWHRSKRFLRSRSLIPTPIPSLLGLERRPIRTVIDVGAFDGDTGRTFQRIFPQASIHCFEPQPSQFRLLSQWAARAGDQVHAYPYALGKETRTAEMLTTPTMPRFSSLLPGTEHLEQVYSTGKTIVNVPVSVRVMRLDDLAPTLSLEDEILVKIDTQGYEREVILGGMNLLSRAVACIAECNVGDNYQNQPTFRDLIDLMDEVGLQYAGNVSQGRIPATGMVGHFDALFVRNTGHQEISGS